MDNTLLERIERLERECGAMRAQARRRSWMAGIALVLGSLVIAIAWARPNSDVPQRIEAREFHASSSSGHSWARFGISRRDSPFLSLHAARSSIDASISQTGQTLIALYYQDPRHAMPHRRFQMTMSGHGELLVNLEGEEDRQTHVPADRPEEAVAP